MQRDDVAQVVALLQPQPEVYALFDQVVVMADGGRIIYQVRDISLVQRG